MSLFDDLLSGVTPTSLGALASGLQITGQLYGAYEKAQYAEQLNKAAQFQADQLKQNAGQARAASQHDAADIERQSQLVASRALAVAAAGGGGASDPGVLNIISRNAAEGAYRRAAALYQGEDRASAMESQAAATEYQGQINSRAAKKESIAQAGATTATLLNATAKNASMYQRFAGGGPKQANSDAPNSGSVLSWLTD